MQKIVGIISIALMTVASIASASPLPDGGITPDEAATALRAAGYPVEMSKDKNGDPIINSKLDGLTWSTWFYECNDDKRCQSIQFAAGFSMKGVVPSRILEWDKTKRFGRAYLDASGDPWIEMDMDLEHGATTEALANDLERWQLVVREFVRFMGYKAPK